MKQLNVNDCVAIVSKALDCGREMTMNDLVYRTKIPPDKVRSGCTALNKRGLVKAETVRGIVVYQKLGVSE